MTGVNFTSDLARKACPTSAFTPPKQMAIRMFQHDRVLGMRALQANLPWPCPHQSHQSQWYLGEEMRRAKLPRQVHWFGRCLNLFFDSLEPFHRVLVEERLFTSLNLFWFFLMKISISNGQRSLEDQTRSEEALLVMGRCLHLTRPLR